MEIAADISCPWCGQAVTLMVDTGIRQQQWTTDCEVCCRPIEVLAECEPGEILNLDVREG